ncbi:phosphate ABC transporter substrate-binding protein PstS [Victivallis sp. Marseille-Q1083]|uniref:phosphate ABC transporter substrate-binding protein PstS n=1 Tax=Victivallis sp. Marseille-Q1083 TaxID=2717288 RepID=UPI00158E017E|nr:phosphate ABC transporter substrate-binding protein PstS [Victivallis sp. Marseille-Q1083]
MKKYRWMAALLAGMFGTGMAAAETVINAAGASFPAPVYQVWTYQYGEEHRDVQVNYQSIGSGAGLNQIKAGTIDFAGSDNPLTAEELKAAGLVQFPMLTGGVVVIYNLPGIKNNTLALDQATLAGIFLGKIKKWNDPAIQKLNPGLKLPKLPISVVHRADSSGTTFIFTNYLSKISEEWANKVGCGPAVKWPVGIGGQKNPGVCNNVAKSIGAIGYTEYTYALETKLAMARLKNHDGNIVSAELESFTASSANADWNNAPGFYMVLTDQPGEKSWPITGLTYIVLKAEQNDPAKCDAMLDYFNWCLTDGAEVAEKLHYVALPDSLCDKLRQLWQQQFNWQP